MLDAKPWCTESQTVSREARLSAALAYTMARSIWITAPRHLSIHALSRRCFTTWRRTSVTPPASHAYAVAPKEALSAARGQVADLMGRGRKR